MLYLGKDVAALRLVTISLWFLSFSFLLCSLIGAQVVYSITPISGDPTGSVHIAGFDHAIVLDTGHLTSVLSTSEVIDEACPSRCTQEDCNDLVNTASPRDKRPLSRLPRQTIPALREPPPIPRTSFPNGVPTYTRTMF
jgi:hypothetical protein